MASPVIGIDLGTTNCCVAVLDGERPRVLEDETGYRTTPSYLSLTEEGKFLVGRRAKGQVLTHPQTTLYGIKRLIGRPYNTPEVARARQLFSFPLVEAVNGECLISASGKMFTPQQLSAVLLQRLREMAIKALKRDVRRCVITVPAYFNSIQREMTKKAGELAGLEVMRLINEPTAAALAFGYRAEMKKRVLVYDLGGGTFDVSILEIADNVFEVVTSRGDSFLGGIDFDQRLLDHFLENFKQQNGVDLRGDIFALQRLKDAAENAKCDLSQEEEVEIILPGITSSHNFEMTLSRTKVEELCQDLVKRTIYLVTAALNESGLSLKEIDDILLVGGQTRMPLVARAISSLFNKTPSKKVHPDEAVAIGAAIQGATLAEGEEETPRAEEAVISKGAVPPAAKKVERPLLVDVTPHHLGIEAAGNVFSKIIEKNTPVPCRYSRVFSTSADFQKEVRITVRQGEEKEANKNAFLGEFVLTGIRQAKRLEPKIEVEFAIDTNGILQVRARDLDTLTEQKIEIHEFKPGEKKSA